MSDVVIRVENLCKEYRLGTISHGTLYRDIQSGWAKLRGAEDPNARIGSVNREQLNNTNDRFSALKNVSFDVRKGEIVGIIGRNGAGKSTLLKIISRVTAPTSGTIKIKGRVASLLEVGTGFHPELTGRENIFLNGAILGMHKGEIEQKFDEIVKFAEIDQFIDTPVKRYSSGMYVRLAFAVAAHLEPEILVVDEVLAVGDAQFQKKCLGKMGEVAKGGRTVLFVSHNMGAIYNLCNRCILLNKGIKVKYGLTNEVIQEYISSGLNTTPEYYQAHLSEKNMNLRSAKIILENGQLASSEIRYDESFKIVIEYEINQKINGCTVWIALETTSGTMVFTSADFDTDLSLLEEREIGNYRASVKIPSKWLNYGGYILVVGLVQNNPVVIFDRVETFKFYIMEINSPSSHYQSGTRRGVLQPVLDWQTEKCF